MCVCLIHVFFDVVVISCFKEPVCFHFLIHWNEDNVSFSFICVKNSPDLHETDALSLFVHCYCCN